MGLLIDILGEVNFLRNAPREVRVEAMVLGRCVDEQKGHRFWQAGAPGEFIVVPVTGELKSTAVTLDGHELIDRIVEPGGIAGLESAFDGMPQATTCEVTHAGAFFLLSREALQRLVRTHPVIHQGVHHHLGCLYRQQLRDHQEMALRPVAERLALFLLDHACVLQDRGARILLHVSQSEVAARLGTAREVVARSMSALVARGVLERTDDAVFVRDWDGLHREAGLRALPEEVRSRQLPCDGTPLDRTRHFFLQRGRDWRGHGLHDAAACQAFLGDLARCRKNGCPAAAAAAVGDREPGSSLTW